MRCISTLAVMNNRDHELAAARHRLAEQLAEIRRGAGLGEDESPDLKSVWAEAGWVYVCSVPRREEDGAIGYVHLFRHRWAATEGRYLSLPVVASPGWSDAALSLRAAAGPAASCGWSPKRWICGLPRSPVFRRAGLSYDCDDPTELP